MDNKGINWKQFLVTLLGTAIGVALTFTLNGIRESNKKERAQRLTAIMIIHDIDNTVETLKTIKKQEEVQGSRSRLWREQPDSLETAPYDSIYPVLEWLFNDGGDYHFDDSKERIFHSSQDSWQNLGSVKFIDNVQSFYYSRRGLEDLLNTDDKFIYPVPQKEYREYIYDADYQTGEDYENLVRKYLKRKFSEKGVRYFLDNAPIRARLISQYIDNWSRMNDENKFMMGITDQEMDDYINSITQTGVAVTARKLLGTWKMEHAQGNAQNYYEFRKDSLFSFVAYTQQPWITADWSGTLKTRLEWGGKWRLQGDSLITVNDPKSVVVNLDISEMVAVEGKKDSLDARVKEYREEWERDYTRAFEGISRNARKVRMDASRDKIEWTSQDGTVFYSTRMK